jgi:hypothetical protein
MTESSFFVLRQSRLLGDFNEISSFAVAAVCSSSYTVEHNFHDSHLAILSSIVARAKAGNFQVG